MRVSQVIGVSRTDGTEHSAAAWPQGHTASKGVVGRDGNSADEARSGRCLAEDEPPVVLADAPDKALGRCANTDPVAYSLGFSPGGAPCLTLAHVTVLRPAPH